MSTIKIILLISCIFSARPNRNKLIRKARNTRIILIICAALSTCCVWRICVAISQFDRMPPPSKKGWEQHYEYIMGDNCLKQEDRELLEKYNQKMKQFFKENPEPKIFGHEAWSEKYLAITKDFKSFYRRGATYPWIDKEKTKHIK